MKSHKLTSSLKGLHKWVLIAVVLSIPFVVTNLYYLHLINLIGIYSLVVIGLNILSGYTGQVSMGQAGFFAVGTYTSALLMMKLQAPFWVATVMAAIVAAIFGVVIAIPALRLTGPYLVMATVGFGEIIRLVLVNWVPVTKGAAGLTGIPAPSFFGFTVFSERSFFYLIYAVVALGILVAVRISRSKIGRTFMAIREDELAAESMGVPTNIYKVAAFAIGAAYAGVAGSIFGSFSGVASPDGFTFDDSVGFLCMSVIGGNRSIFGALIGSITLTLLSELLRFMQSYRLIVYGAILLLTAIFMPQGLSGLGPILREFLSRRKRDKKSYDDVQCSQRKGR
ncbi:MAG: branched-chain amino acid ABC transporter permease [Firmicutes bacterium]|nr:branched-chain amino acid ABC transporter permease [Bacillota bacterium]